MLLFYYNFPKKHLEKINNVIKKYDLFSLLQNVKKGIEDTIQH